MVEKGKRAAAWYLSQNTGVLTRSPNSHPGSSREGVR